MKNKGGRYSLLIIGVMTVLLLIPVLILGSFIMDAFSQRGEPVLGHRFDHDLPQKIQKSQLDAIKKDLSEWPSVQSVTVDVPTAMLKIYLEAKVETADDAVDLCHKVYDRVVETLPVETYFTKTDSVKNYDLEINVYNQLDAGESQIYVVANKSSGMDKLMVQELTKAKSPDVVENVHNRLQQRNATPASGGQATPVEEKTSDGQ